MSLCCQILTKDSVTVFVNGIMYFKVKNAIHAVANVDDFGGSARLLAATTLRNVLGTMTLGEILSHRENIAKEMKVEWVEIIKAVYDMYSISYIERRTDEKFEYQISTKIYELVEMHDENREIFT